MFTLLSNKPTDKTIRKQSLKTLSCDCRKLRELPNKKDNEKPKEEMQVRAFHFSAEAFQELTHRLSIEYLVGIFETRNYILFLLGPSMQNPVQKHDYDPMTTTTGLFLPNIPKLIKR